MLVSVNNKCRDAPMDDGGSQHSRSTIRFRTPEFAQFGTAGEQVILTPLRLNATTVEDDNPVGALECDTAMRHGDHRSVICESPQSVPQ